MEELTGQKLKHDIITGTGMVLVPAGTVLNQEHFRLLRMHRVPLEELRFVEERQQSKSSTAETVKQAADYSKHMFQQIRRKKKVPLLDIKHEFIPMVRQAAEDPDLFRLFEAVRAKDEYTHQHNVGVSVLSTMLGNWCKLDEQELNLLSLGASLHDVGKIRISDEILNKPGKLTKSEFEEMKLHTVYGYEMLKESAGLNPRVAFMALQHHEREDGSGYPLKLKGPQIDKLARIVAVADVFHAMSSQRPYHTPLPFHELISQMRLGIFGELDPYIVSLFLKNILGSMIGKQVLLSDGRYGEVVYINPHEETYPLVKVEDVFVDLSRERGLRISKIMV
ncbi:HD-GYP domain-containing protein [Paenibacillus sp. YN15]|uniref:HD-GYP domain-containing protein n=1 Tax=Paenibacillus sp. YN15 TaxID=1742774 RepID=UPI000DCB2E17|nr:HD-GYP domain-containing protein [Paenibacillus sp. YN15]RAU91526.1 HD-GYP domain-containing protein [Paenibacillus sp. YN15]